MPHPTVQQCLPLRQLREQGCKNDDESVIRSSGQWVINANYSSSTHKGTKSTQKTEQKKTKPKTNQSKPGHRCTTTAHLGSGCTESVYCYTNEIAILTSCPLLDITQQSKVIGILGRLLVEGPGRCFVAADRPVDGGDRHRAVGEAAPGLFVKLMVQVRLDRPVVVPVNFAHHQPERVVVAHHARQRPVVGRFERERFGQPAGRD